MLEWPRATSSACGQRYLLLTGSSAGSGRLEGVESDLMPDDLPALAGGQPVRETYLPYARQSIDEEDVAAVTAVLRSEWLTTGPKIREFEEAFAARVGAYNEAFADLPEVETPTWPDPAEAEPAWHLYVLALRPERLRADRRTVFLALRAENIGVNVHYIPVHTHPYYRWLLNSNVNVCTLEEPSPAPRAEAFYERILTLPLFPAMTGRDVEDVISAVRNVILHYRR